MRLTSSLAATSAIFSSDAALVRLALQQVAALAADQLGVPADQLREGAGPTTDSHALQLLGTLDEASLALAAAVRRTEGGGPPRLTAEGGAGGEGGGERGGERAMSTRFPLFGWLRRDLDAVLALAGGEVVPPIVRPVRLTLVADSVSDYDGALAVLRHAAQLCTVISHQAGRMRNSYALRASLLEHIAARVLPLPLPLPPRRPKHVAAALAQGGDDEALGGWRGVGEWDSDVDAAAEPACDCFWWRRGMRAATQLELLRLLSLLSRHYATVVLSMNPTVLSDASRILTFASFAALADAVVRRTASDCPSAFSLQYSGAATGPSEPYAFTVDRLRDESATMRLHDESLLANRTRLLDYFASTKALLLPPIADEAGAGSEAAESDADGDDGMWAVAAKEFGKEPFSNGRDRRYEEVKAALREQFGRDAVNERSKPRLKALAAAHGVEASGEAAAPKLSGPDPARTCFRFDSTMQWGGGDAALIDQLTYRVGYPSHGFPEAEGKPDAESHAAASPAPWRYFTGEAAEFAADCPELGALRDTVLRLDASARVRRVNSVSSHL